METRDKSVGLRLDRTGYEKSMKLKKQAKDKGDPVAYSTQSWFSMLVMMGIDEYNQKNKGE